MMLVRALSLNLDITWRLPTTQPLSTIPGDAHFDFTALVPMQLQAILEESPEKIDILNRMKGIIIGGAPVSSHLEHMIQTIEAPVYQTYGMTETISHVALRRLNPPQTNYEALSGVTFTTDDRGCLVIRDEALGIDQLVTNDLATLSDSHHFSWIGRADHTINSGGIKINLDQAERALGILFTKLGLNNRYVLLGSPHDKLGTQLLLVVESKAPLPISISQLREACKAHFPRYQSPRGIYVVSRFVEKSSGKIDRQGILGLIEKR